MSFYFVQLIDPFECMKGMVCHGLERTIDDSFIS